MVECGNEGGGGGLGGEGLNSAMCLFQNMYCIAGGRTHCKKLLGRFRNIDRLIQGSRWHSD